MLSNPNDPATDKQKAYVRALGAARAGYSETDIDGMSKREASRIIEELSGPAPKKRWKN